jgi:hypothetical protein
MFTFRPLSEKDEQNYNKFMMKINKMGSPRSNHSLSQCWTHITSISSSGYGQIMFQNKAWGLHVYSYWIHSYKPDLEHGYDISHLCDNKECCNPEHLEYITHTKNVQDGVKRIRKLKPKKEKKKGNFKTTPGSFKPGDQIGENNSTAILTWKNVKEIREIHSKGLRYGDLKKLSEKYGVCVRAIENIINNKSWVEKYI